MEIYTAGFTQKTAAEFFGRLREAGIRRLLDVRLHNSSQLAGFAKRDDLRFFLRELCQAEYVHDLMLAPTEELLAAYKKKRGSWSEYERAFLALMAERQIETHLLPSFFETRTVLLCSEDTPDRCHRRLVAEYLQSKWTDIEIVHL